jgi:hypothetical protein
MSGIILLAEAVQREKFWRIGNRFGLEQKPPHKAVRKEWSYVHAAGF